MSKNETNIPDAFNDLLKKFLLEQEGGPDGGGLDKGGELEKLSDQVFSGSYEQTPSAIKEAEMLSKLKDKFANPSPEPPKDPPADGPGPEATTPPPGPSMIDWIWQNKLIVLTTSGLVAVLAFLFVLNTGYFKGDQIAEGPIDRGGGKIEDTYGPNGPDGSSEEEMRRGNIARLSDSLAGGDTLHDFVFGEDRKTPINLEEGLPEDKSNLASTEATDTTESARNFTNRSPIVDPNRSPVDLPFPVLQLFSELSPKPTIKKIYGKKDQLIFGKQGTMFAIPAGCFAFEDGSPVTGEVEIEIIEAYKKGDIIAANVPTVEAEHYLESQGMFNIHATSEGYPVKLVQGKNIYVEFDLPGVKDDPDMELYRGNYDPTGHMVWATAGGYTGSMVPLPIREINFEQFRSPVRGNKTWDEYISQLNSPRYEGTLVATWEFVERLKVARRMGFMAQILEMYMNNPNLNMYEVDQMVAYHLRGNYRNYENKDPKNLGVEDFERFYYHALKKPTHFSSYNVDLDASNARQLLAKENLTEARINSVMRTHQLRKQYLKEINGPIEYKVNSAKSKNISGLTKIPGTATYCWEGNTSFVNRKRSSGFRIDRLGWYNLDQIFPPKGNKNLDVTISGDEIGDANTRVFLVMLGAKTVVPGKDIGGGTFQFKRLSRGTRAKIFTLKYDGSTPYMAEKDITIMESSNTSLDLTATSIEGMKAKLKEYNVY